MVVMIATHKERVHKDGVHTYLYSSAAYLNTYQTRFVSMHVHTYASEAEGFESSWEIISFR